MESPGINYPNDLRLARSVVDGSVEAWHAFVLSYSALVFSVVRRYFPNADEDAPRDAYVRTLEHFYRSGLTDYDGNTSLATWVMTVSRSRCLDVLRNRAGRKRFPAWVKALSEQERFVYLAYFWRGESYVQIAERWGRRRPPLTRDVFLEALDRIESQLNRRSRTAMAYEIEARSVPGISKRLLEYMDHARIEIEEQRDSASPDFRLIEEEARQVLDRIAACVQELTAEERRVVELHFYQVLPASQIARALGVRGPRRVYSIVQRAVASLRRRMDEPRLDSQKKSTLALPSSDSGGTRD